MATLGDYVIERELGRGAMGVVWLARHGPLGTARAVKVLEGVGDAEAAVRFRREAEALARVGGEVVVPVHEIGFDRGRIYFSMDVMPRGSLRARMTPGVPWPWRDAAMLGLALARGLERCHACGIVHRDLKPDNVLFDEQDRPRLADFGIARDMKGSVLTETGTIIGTPAYMPPEQLAGERVDARADLYALGVLLQELLTGERPFEGKTTLAVFEEKKRERRRPLPATTPRALVALVARTTAARPEGRFASAEEVARALERVLAGEKQGPLGGKAAWLAGLASVAALLVASGVILSGGREPLAPPAAQAPPPAPPAPPPSTGSPEERRVSAQRLLAEAATKLSSKLPAGEVRHLVEHALEQEVAPELLSTERARVVEAALERCEAIAVNAQRKVLEAKELEAPMEEVFALRALAQRLDPAIKTSPGVGSLAALYFGRKYFQTPTDWNRCCEAVLIAFETGGASVEAAATMAVRCAQETKPPLPEKMHRVIARACEVALGDELRFRVAVKHVQFLGLTGRGDEMLALALALAEPSTSSERMGNLARALLQAKVARPLDGAKIDVLVAVGGEIPEMLLLRAVHDKNRNGDVFRALEVGLTTDFERTLAADVAARDHELLVRCIAMLEVKGDEKQLKLLRDRAR